MPKFYFHLRDDMSVDDEEGLELSNLDVARRLAFKYAVNMGAASILEYQKLNLDHRIEVTNEAGEDVLTVRFGDVITIESGAMDDRC